MDNRPFIAQTIMGPSAELKKTRIEYLDGEKVEVPSLTIQKLKDNGIELPEDFIMTPFDEFVLSIAYSEFQTPNAEYIASRLTAAYSSMLDFVFNERDNRGIGHSPFSSIQYSEVNNYLSVLTGAEGHDHNFPDFRTKYNLLYMWFKAKEHDMDSNKSKKEKRLDNFLPDYKREIQFAVAMGAINGKLQKQIGKELGISQRAIVPVFNLIKLDLMEKYPQEIINIIINTVESHPVMEGNNSEDALNYINQIRNGEILASVTKTMFGGLSRWINSAISEFWLRKLESDSQLFKAENTTYIREALEIYIRGKYQPNQTDRMVYGETPMGTVNEWFKALIGNSPTLGGFIVRLASGQDIENISVPDIVDNAINARKAQKTQEDSSEIEVDADEA